MKIEELVHTAHCKRVRPTRAKLFELAQLAEASYADLNQPAANDAEWRMVA